MNGIARVVVASAFCADDINVIDFEEEHLVCAGVQPLVDLLVVIDQVDGMIGEIDHALAMFVPQS